jgi:hypothetical protein
MPENTRKNATTGVLEMTGHKKRKQIPPPPEPNASWEEQAAYFEKYGTEELEEAGHLQALTEEDQRFVEEVKAEAGRRIAARKARGQLNLALSPEQLNRFSQYANRKHIPPSTLAKAWILERLDQEAKDP